MRCELTSWLYMHSPSHTSVTHENAMKHPKLNNLLILFGTFGHRNAKGFNHSWCIDDFLSINLWTKDTKKDRGRESSYGKDVVESEKTQPSLFVWLTRVLYILVTSLAVFPTKSNVFFYHNYTHKFKTKGIHHGESWNDFHSIDVIV